VLIVLRNIALTFMVTFIILGVALVYLGIYLQDGRMGGMGAFSVVPAILSGVAAAAADDAS
jgi:hypothetical protein